MLYVCDGKKYAYKAYKKTLDNILSTHLREIVTLRLSGSLDHHVIAITNIIWDKQLKGIIMHQLNNDLYHMCSSISIPIKKQIFRDIMKGISHIHSNFVIHRDIKPGNILLDEDNNAFITDFSLAKIITENMNDNCSHTAEVVTAGYRAPELEVSDAKYNQAIDMWSIGVMYTELMFRQWMGFASNKEASLFLDSIDFSKLHKLWLDEPDLITITKGLLNKDPSKRFTANYCMGVLLKDKKETKKSSESVNSKSKDGAVIVSSTAIEDLELLFDDFSVERKITKDTALYCVEKGYDTYHSVFFTHVNCMNMKNHT